MDTVWGKESRWIWYENAWNSGQSTGKNEMAYFRRTFNAPANAALTVRVSADSRYRLYVNGISISVGPCKGHQWYTYYEQVDVTPYLQVGRNVLAAKVLHLSNNQPYEYGPGGPTSIVRTSSGGFMLDGIMLDSGGNELEDLSTNEKWKVAREAGVKFISGRYGICSTIFESIDGESVIRGWNRAEYNDDLWNHAVSISESLLSPKPMSDYGQSNGWNLTQRPIPPMYEENKRFAGIKKSSCSKEKLENFLSNGDKLVFPLRSSYFIELDAGELTTGYLNFAIEGGYGGSIRVIYSECYEEYRDGTYKKGVRDRADGVLRGDTDTIEPGRGWQEYEFFLFRTFRYIRLEIVTSEEDLVLHKCTYRETGYPLDVRGKYESSDPTHSRLWDISLRTLRRCMHETYEDCPYYEQLQYIMDTRLQALFTYQISSDDRLARRAIHDFHSSLTPMGLLQSRFPSVMPQIIPGFSLHWIFMLKDHLMYFGDLDLIRRYRPTIDAVLDWFDRKLTEQGMVDKTGYWSFVDWVEGWDQVSVPPANRKGPMTVYNLMYVVALVTAAELNEVTGRTGIADEYRLRAKEITTAVQNNCWDSGVRFFTDGPGVKDFSQHAQVWAVLAGAVKGEEAKDLLKRALKADIARISYVMSFYLFRALEMTGLYSETERLLDTWRNLADLNLTTWVEDPVTQRSDCHGWGALPLYEFPAMILGVKPGDIGYGRILIRPYPGTLKHAKGVVSTKKGAVNVSWKVEDGKFSIDVTGPDSIVMEVILPDGTMDRTDNGHITCSCSM